MDDKSSAVQWSGAYGRANLQFEDSAGRLLANPSLGAAEFLRPATVEAILPTAGFDSSVGVIRQAQAVTWVPALSPRASTCDRFLAMRNAPFSVREVVYWAPQAMFPAANPIGTLKWSTRPQDYRGTPANQPNYPRQTTRRHAPRCTLIRCPDVEPAAAAFWYRTPALGLSPGGGNSWEDDISALAESGGPFVPPVIGDLSGVITALSYAPPNRQISGNWRFDESPVNLTSGWGENLNIPTRPHGNGAFDYTWSWDDRVGQRNFPFPVRSPADGIVVFVGWNVSSGNSIVIEHQSAGLTVRSNFQHLVGDPAGDIRLMRDVFRFCRPAGGVQPAWRRCSDAGLNLEGGNAELAMFALRGSGEAPPKWGTNEHVLRVREGDRVAMGQVVGWAGDTGLQSGGVHLHFSMAIAARVSGVPGRDWWNFDPYGLYSPTFAYGGIYPSGARGRIFDHQSMFAPVMPYHALVPGRIEVLARDYYAQRAWNPVAVATARVDCEGIRWRGDANVGVSSIYSNQATGTEVSISLSRQQLAVEVTDRARQSLAPRMISVTGRRAARGVSGQARFSVVWQPIFGVVQVSLALLWQASGRAILERIDDQIPSGSARILDACPYYDGDSLFVAVVAVPVLARDDDDYQLDSGIPGLEIRLVLERMRNSGRLVTRLHHFRLDGRLLFLIVHRRARRGEQWFWMSEERDNFAERANQMAQLGFQATFFDCIVTDRRELYYCGFASPWDSEHM